MDKIVELMQHKWILIWLFTSLIKWVVQIRKKDFIFFIFLTDIFFALIVWYVFWELVKDWEMYLIVKVLFVWIMSANAFALFSVLFDPNFFKSIIIWLIEKKTWIDLSGNKKTNEKNKWEK